MTDRALAEDLVRAHLTAVADVHEVDGQLEGVSVAIARTRQRPAWQARLRGSGTSASLPFVARAWPERGSSHQLRSLLVWAFIIVSLVALMLVALIIGAPRQPPRLSTIDIPAELYGGWEATVWESPSRSATYHLGLGPELHLVSSVPPSSADLGGAFVVHSVPFLRDVYSITIDGPCGLGRYLGTVIDNTGLRFTLLADTCAQRAVILVRSRWEFVIPGPGPTIGPFEPGRTYDSGVFTEPFTFVMPTIDYVGVDAGLEGQFDHASRQVSDGGLRYGGMWWSMRILDDVPVPADLCRAERHLLADIPPTPEAVAAWFRRSGLPISEPLPLPVDGRTALRWTMTEAEPGCRTGRMPAAGLFTYLDFAYAIPTGHDTILIVGGSDDVNDATVQRAVDELVRSMKFE